ncbi:Uncharacterized protein dnm_098020 [Desulfonema magnum]|uniref:Uncharacterized protein n=1 Tax=Desulfonema magnum TaxID=45655 RepID=A0A975BXV7_9BACT|nr:Uncharacterized protein dnm_098020 [Desulfonema magnum]
MNTMSSLGLSKNFKILSLLITVQSSLRFGKNIFLSNRLCSPIRKAYSHVR